MNTMQVSKYIPCDVFHIILEYDGRIKYENGKYVNIIHKHDERYDIITPLIHKKIEIMKTMELSGSGFYFEFGFNMCKRIGLVYDYNFSYTNRFEICYYDFRNRNAILVRTYL
jgi:hypothetical protein